MRKRFLPPGTVPRKKKIRHFRRTAEHRTSRSFTRGGADEFSNGRRAYDAIRRDR